jgi:hypothetical protein
MATLLPPDALREKARVRGVLVEAVATCAAALGAGRNVLLLAASVERGIALAEAIAGTACEAGICLGVLTLPGRASLLLGPPDVVAEQFVDDVWLIVREADSEVIARVADYSERPRLDAGWRAILVSSEPLKTILAQTDARTRRRFAFVPMAAA